MINLNRGSTLITKQPLSPSLPKGHQVIEFEEPALSKLDDISVHKRGQYESNDRPGIGHERLGKAARMGKDHTQVDNANSSPAESANPIIKIWGKSHPDVFRSPAEPVDGDVWQKIRVEMGKYDDKMCKAWSSELDIVLLFTGLFVMASTLFCIQSFQNLTQNPADTTNAFLLALSLQLANSSSPIADASIIDAFAPAKHSVQTNALYFVSLSLALCICVVCILCKQWIWEYEKDIAGTSCDMVRVRQMRYDSLQAWKVPQIISTLPMLLLATLSLFLAGILVQLWHASEHTTAIAVSAIVGLTGILVMITTLAPAYCGNWHSRAAFVPFRSPQAWVFFAAYRRVQYWWDSLFDTFHGENPPILSGWNAFDLHFLQTEKEWWFEHDIKSIHRVLRWVYHTLTTSDDMKKCVLWCLQTPETMPENLVSDYYPLASYVLPEKENNSPCYWPDRAWYDLSCGEYTGQSIGIAVGSAIGSSVGRYQVELLIRTSNEAIHRLSTSTARNWREIIDQVNDCCYRLYSTDYDHDVFGSVSCEDAQYQRDIHNQISLMLQRLFAAFRYCPHRLRLLPDMYYIVALLFTTSSDSTTAFSLKVTRDVVVKETPAMLLRANSVSLALALAEPMAFWAWDHFDVNERAFVKLDKVILELWSKQSQWTEGLREENWEKWRSLRKKALDDHGVDLAELNGGFPTWKPSKGPLGLHTVFAGLGINKDAT